jgi:hypothetical protein
MKLYKVLGYPESAGAEFSPNYVPQTTLPVVGAKTGLLTVSTGGKNE